MVVACGRVVQDGADFSLPVKTCLSTQAVHLFITRRSTSTVLYWSCTLPIPSRRISQAVSNHSLCSHFGPASVLHTVPGQRSQQDVRTGLPDFKEAHQNSENDARVSGFSLPTLRCLFCVKHMLTTWLE